MCNSRAPKMLVPIFNPERIQIDAIDLSVSDRDARTDAMAGAHGLPYLGQFLAEIARMQSEEGDRFGRRYQREALAQALAQDELPLRLPIRTVITMGHVNFAHHLWNELSALETIIQSGSLRADTSILVARETLGPLEQIFPELKNQPIYRVGDNK